MFKTFVSLLSGHTSYLLTNLYYPPFVIIFPFFSIYTIINVSEEVSLTLYCTIEIYVTWLYQTVAFVHVFISFVAAFSYF